MKRAVWLTRNHHGTTWVKDGRVPVVQYGNDQLKVLPCDLKSNFLRTKTCMRLSLIKLSWGIDLPGKPEVYAVDWTTSV